MVLVALPTLNEEYSIKDMIQRIHAGGYELIVVDGGSTDLTVQLAMEAGATVHFRDKYGNGYGGGIMKAMEVAEARSCDFLVVIDCDLSYQPEDISLLVRHAEDFDLVMGIRPFNKIDWLHRLANIIHSNLAALLFGRSVSDINTGLRLFKVPVFRPYLTERNMGMMPQISAFAMRNHLRIKEIPVQYKERIGISKSDVLDAVVVTWCIIRERLRKKK